MILRRTRGILATTATTALILGLGACTADDEPAADPTPTAEPTDEPEEDPDEAAVRDVVERYWEARISIQNNPPGDPDAFKGIVGGTGSFVEKDRQVARTYAEDGVRRIGRPELSEPVLTRTNPDEFIVSQCFDELEWTFEKNGEQVFPQGLEDYVPRRRDLTVARQNDQWLVMDEANSAREEGPCPAYAE